MKAYGRRPLLFLLILVIGYLLFSGLRILAEPGSRDLLTWLGGNGAARGVLTVVGQESCPGATFIVPAGGDIGLFYGDPRGPYSNSHRHQGIDIFSKAEVGIIPVYAAYEGYITREANWKSSLIERVADDPLQPGRQIWLYYTHMADSEGHDFIEPAFPAGTHEIFVQQGTLLGYTGNYSGNPLRPVGVHLHFSIVRDDGRGHYLNELEIDNTLDPSPYLGLPVNYACTSLSTTNQCSTVPTCQATEP